jgi:uncharacterized membrane protein YcgQ (UPF0703/DUF1980 family)
LDNWMMATTIQIENVGERLVANWLAQHGYSINIDTRSLDSSDIEARGYNTSLLVQVKSASQPSTPEMLSSDDEGNIISRAARLGLQPWEARVQLDQQLRQVGDIKWRKLG